MLIPSHDALRVLVVEDEFILATELMQELNDAGITAIGPASTLDDGQRLFREAARVDGAVLDISLHGEMVYPLADELQARSVPFLFATGYDMDTIPDRFSHVQRHAKPVYIDKVIAAISGVMDENPASPCGA